MLPWTSVNVPTSWKQTHPQKFSSRSGTRELWVVFLVTFSQYINFLLFPITNGLSLLKKDLHHSSWIAQSFPSLHHFTCFYSLHTLRPYLISRHNYLTCRHDYLTCRHHHLSWHVDIIIWHIDIIAWQVDITFD